MPDANGNINWGDVLDQIATRIIRPGLDRLFIQIMADEVVTMLESEGYFPSKQTDETLTTQPGQYMYRVPKGATQVLFARILLGNVWINVVRANSYEELVAQDPVAPNFTAIPSTMRVFGRLFRLFPTPNANYPIELTVDRKVDLPTDAEDTENFWVDEGRAIIINGTAEYLCRTYTRDYDRADQLAMKFQEAKDSMDIVTYSRQGAALMERYL